MKLAYLYVFYFSCLAIPLSAIGITSPIKKTVINVQTLSEYEKTLLERVRLAGTSDLELAMAMDANDLSLGYEVRNCSPIWHYFLVAKNQESIPLMWNEAILKELIINRPYLIIVSDPFSHSRKITFLKNSIKNNRNAPHLLIYDEKLHSFKQINQEIINQLQIDPSSILLFSKKKLVDDNRVTHYSAKATPKQQRTPVFYHEKQKQGQCAIHAMNAFFGQRIANANDLAHFNQVYFGYLDNSETFSENRSPSDFLDNHFMEPEIWDASEGNNPATLHAYILHLANREKGLSNFKDTQFIMFDSIDQEDLDLMEAFLFEKDRCLIGSLFPDHFIAFRKDQEDVWFKIDSENSKQQAITPFEFLSQKRNQKAFLFF